MAKQSISFNLPCNIEAEKAVLGAMLVDKSIFYEMIGRLTADCFYPDGSPNQLVYNAMRRVDERKIECDVQTLTAELINSKELDLVGGPEYLLELSESPISFSNIEQYVRIVLDQKLLRNYLNAIMDVVSKYKKEKIGDISEFVASAEEELREISKERRVGDFKKIGDIVGGVKAAIETQKNDDGLIGLTSGYETIDKYTLGFRKQDLIIIAARPSVGKTALAINMALNGAKSKDAPSAIFSLEMSADLLIKRLIGATGEIDLTRLQQGALYESERSKLNKAVNELSRIKLFIDDTPNCKLNDIISKSRKLKKDHPDLGIIVIDYIGLIDVGENEKKKQKPRQEEVAYISKSLKQLARELDIPIIVLCQLGRGAEAREDKRPLLVDLRESGQIEQDADIVMLLSREKIEKTAKNFGNKKFANLKDDEKLKAEKERQLKVLFDRFNLGESVDSIVVNIAKNRNGKTGELFLHFFKNYGSFVPPSKEFIDQMKRIESLTVDSLNKSE